MPLVNSTGMREIPNADSDAVTLGWTPAVGNHLFVMGSGWRDGAAGGFQAAVSDNQSHTYAEDIEQNDGGSGNATEASIWSVKIAQTGSPFTVTIDPTGTGNYFSYCVFEWSGLAATNHLDRTGSTALATGSTLTVNASGANVQADTLVLGCAVFNATTTNDAGISDPPSGYTSLYVLQDNDPGSSHGECGQGSSKVVSSIETSSISWTWNQTTRPSAGVIATYKLATAGAHFNLRRREHRPRAFAPGLAR